MFNFSLYWIIIIFIGLIFIGLSLASSKTVAFIAKVFVFYVMRMFQEFEIDEINLYPLRIKRLHLKTFQSRKKPQAVLKWDVMSIKIDWTSLSALQGLLSLIAQTESFFGSILRYFSKFTNNKVNASINNLEKVASKNEYISKTLVRIKFENFHFESPGLQFKHILQSASDDLYGDKTNQKILLSQCKGSHSYIMTLIFKQVSSFFEIEFDNINFEMKMPNNINFEMKMPTQYTIIKGNASRMRIYTNISGSTSIFGLIGNCHINKGNLVIIHKEIEAMNFKSEKAVMIVDMFIPTGHQEVQMKLQGDQDLKIQTEPFLDFYHNYTAAEDNAYEMKMAKGISTNGKMNKMAVSLGEMKMLFYDKRSDTELKMRISDLNASLETFFLTPQGRKFRVQDDNDSINDADIIDGCNLFKVMTVSLNKVDFQQDEDDNNDNNNNNSNNELAHIHDIKASIEKTVKFQDMYNDEERMDAKIGFICFEKMSPILLKWLFILQDVSDNLPNSRFSHFKHTFATFNCQEVRFNICNDTLPDIDNLEVSVPLIDQLSSSSSLTEVCFFFYDMSAEMDKISNEGSSQVIFKTKSMKIDTSIPLYDMCNIYSLEVHDDNDNTSKLGCSFDFDNFNISFKMGKTIDFEKLVINEGMTISLSSSSLLSSSSPIIVPFFKSNIVNGIWDGPNVELDLGDVDVLVSVSSLLKFQLCFDITKQSVDKALAIMKHVKSSSSFSKSDIDIIINDDDNDDNNNNSNIESPLTSVKMTTLIVNSSHNSNNDNDNSLNFNMKFDNFSYKFSEVLSVYSWSTFVMHLNNYPYQPWIIINDFLFETKKMKLNHHHHHHHSNNNNSINNSINSINNDNDNDMKYDNITLNISEFLIKFYPDIGIGKTVDLLLNQNDANKLAGKYKSNYLSKIKKCNYDEADDNDITIDLDDFDYNDNDNDNNIINNNNNKNKNNFYNDDDPSISKLKASICIKKMEFSMHATYKDVDIEDFMILDFHGLEVNLDSTKDYDDVNNDIFLLDTGTYLQFDDDNNNDDDTDNDDEYRKSHDQKVYTYTGISGGIVSMSVSKMGLKFKPLKFYYLSMDDFSLKGPLYSASISDHRIKSKVVDVILTDTDVYNPLLSITLLKGSAPSKLYSDLVIVGKSFSIIQVDESLKCLEAFNNALSSCLPPNDDPSPSLVWWDNHRFWMHGLFHLKFEEFRFYYVVSTQDVSKLTLFAHIDQFQLFNDSKKLECCGQRMSLEADLDNILLKKNSDTDTRISSGKNHLDNVSLDSRLNARKQGHVVELVSIPGMFFSLQHERADSYQLLYSHHDVYLESSVNEGDNNDKYKYFRLKRHRINWNIDFHCVDDDKHNPVTLYVRLDVIDRILKAFSKTSNNLDAPSATESDTSSSSSSSSTTTSSSGQISLLDVVRRLSIRMKLKEFVVCSWISRLDLVGFVFYQKNMRLDMSMSRHYSKSKPHVQRRSVTFAAADNDKLTGDDKNNNNDDDNATLKMDSLFTDIDIADLYFRDWGITHFADLVGGLIDFQTPHKNPFNDSQGFYESPSNPHISREPSNMNDIKHLFKQIHKLAHATKVEVELSEEDVNAASESKDNGSLSELTSEYIIGKERMKREATITNSRNKYKAQQKKKNNVLKNLMSPSIPIKPPPPDDLPLPNANRRGSVRPNDLTGNNNSRRESFDRRESLKSFRTDDDMPDAVRRESLTRRESIKADDLLNANDDIGEYRPSLFSFQTNHVAMMPPSSSLPVSYLKQNNMNDKNIFSSMISRSQNNDDKTIYGRKIWKIRVIDIRLLWSLSLRDHIFAYVIKCLDMFVNNDDSKMNPGKSEKKKGILTPKPKESAGLKDFKEIEANSPMSPMNGPTYESRIEKYFGVLSNDNNNDDFEVRVHETNNAALGKRRSGNTSRRSNILKSSKRTGSLADPKRKSVGNVDDNNNTIKSFRYFLVELIDPQVNFLDNKSHSSLIIVSGKSSLQGKRENRAIVHQDGKHVSDPKRKNDIRLLMTGVSAYTVPTMIDGAKEDTVYWVPMDNTTDATLNRRDRRGHHYNKITTNVIRSPHLHKAIEDFEIRSTYTFYLDVKVKEAKSLVAKPTKERLDCKFRLELPEVSVDIESKQFYMMFDVARNVLLAPPPKYSKFNEDSPKKDMTIEITRDGNNRSRALNIKSTTSRDEILNLISNYLTSTSNQDVEYGETPRVIQIYVGKGKWILRSSVDHIAILETEFIGLYADFNNNEDRSTAFNVELQRLWASNNVDLRNDHNLKSASSIESINTNGSSNSSSNLIKKMVVSATIQDVLCKRCNQKFDMDKNGPEECKYHADDEGNEGKYSEVTIKDQLSGRPTTIKAWSCCGRLQEDAFGCCLSAHRCNDSMIKLDIEATPSTRVDNIELTMISNFELTFFHGYKVEIEITKDLTDLLHSYFSIDTTDIDTNELDADDKAQSSSSSSSPLPLSILGTKSNRNLESKTPMKTSHWDKLKRGHLLDTISKENKDGITARDNMLRRDSISNDNNINQNNDIITIDNKRQEGVYIKHMTVGGMTAVISTKGFMFNAEKYEAKINDCSIRHQVLDLNTLLYRIETNAGLSLVANTMSKFVGNFKLSSLLKHFGFEEKLSNEEVQRRAVEEILGTFTVSDSKANNKNNKSNTNSNGNTKHKHKGKHHIKKSS